MSDILEKLDALYNSYPCVTLDEAADEIIRLRKDNEHLRANLAAAVASHQEAVRELTAKAMSAASAYYEVAKERDAMARKLAERTP